MALLGSVKSCTAEPLILILILIVAFPFGYLVFGYLFFLYPGNPRGKGASTSTHFLTLHPIRAQGESDQC